MDGTADLYVTNLRQCRADARGVTGRLVGNLAPLTKRTNKAALLAWCQFAKDLELAAEIREIRLPPARRVGTKLPLPTGDWRKIVRHIETAEPRVRQRGDRRADVVRHVALIVARRGLRVGDVLRIRRTEVTKALKTGILSFEGKGAKRHEYSAAPIREQLEILAAQTKWERVRDLVSGGKNNRSSDNRVRREFARVVGELGLPDAATPHRFRRTYATHYLLEHRGDPRALIKLQHHMGWANISTASMYADAVDNRELADAGDKMTERIFADQGAGATP